MAIIFKPIWLRAGRSRQWQQYLNVISDKQLRRVVAAVAAVRVWAVPLMSARIRMSILWMDQISDFPVNKYNKNEPTVDCYNYDK